MPAIVFHKGSSKQDRATFACGGASLPAAMATRLLNAAAGLSEAALTRLVIQKLAPKHGPFLDALDKAGLTYPQAIQAMKAAVPRRAAGKPRIAKEAAAVARMLCRKFSNQDAPSMLAAFLETAARPEFKVMVVDLVDGYLTRFGRNKQGRIRVRAERKGADAKALAARATKARAAKKK